MSKLRLSLTGNRLSLAGLALFALLSLTDFVQTYVLITQGKGTVYEANPVANAWLESHGWVGLAAFKFGAVAVFAGAVFLLAVHRPRAGTGVLVLGCLALLWVTVYSSRLLANPNQPQQADEEIVVIGFDRVRPQPGYPRPEGYSADSHFRRGGLPHRPIVRAD
jgi:hypothetical protein